MSTTEPQPGPRRGLLRRTLRKWWLPILLVWVVGSIGIGAVIYRSEPFRPTYRAFSLLRVDGMTVDLYRVRAGDEPMEAFLTTQVQLITTPNVLTTAGNDPRAVGFPRIQNTADVVQELKKVIRVAVIPGTSLIEVSMESPSPFEASKLVNAVVDAFMAANMEWSNGKSVSQITTLEDYLNDLTEKSKVVEKRWKDLLSRADLDAPVFLKGQDRRADVTFEQFRELHRALFEIRIELSTAEAWAASVKAAASNAARNPDSPADEALLTQRVDRLKQEPEVVALASQMVEAKSKLDELQRIGTGVADPAEQQALKKLQLIQARYDQLWESRSKQIRADFLGNRPNPDDELREAETKVRALGVRQKALQEQFDRLEVRNRKQAADEVDLVLIRDEYESLKAMQEAVRKRIEQMNFEKRGDARLRLYSVATPPGEPISDPRALYSTLSLMAMLPASFLLFLGFEAVSGSSAPRSKEPAKEEPPAEV